MDDLTDDLRRLCYVPPRQAVPLPVPAPAEPEPTDAQA